MHPHDVERALTSRVLVIDDEPALTNILRRALSNAGFEVEIAHDGAEGLVKAVPLPSVIVLDLHMPVMDGLEFLDAFRSVPGSADIPVVLLSGDRDSTVLRERIARYGEVLIMPKPFELEVLVATVLQAGGVQRGGSV